MKAGILKKELLSLWTREDTDKYSELDFIGISVEEGSMQSSVYREVNSSVTFSLMNTIKFTSWFDDREFSSNAGLKPQGFFPASWQSLLSVSLCWQLMELCCEHFIEPEKNLSLFLFSPDFFFLAHKLCTLTSCKRQKMGSLHCRSLNPQWAFRYETDTDSLPSAISYNISLKKQDDISRLCLRKHNPESRHCHTPKQNMTLTSASEYCPIVCPQKILWPGFSISCNSFKGGRERIPSANPRQQKGMAWDEPHKEHQELFWRVH